MKEIVKKFLEKYKIQNTTVVLGFSSGPDSCALALLLNELKNEFNLKVVLAYFNHGWRKEAIEEEEFTKEFANKFNFGYEIKKAPCDVAKNEEVARNLRYDFFEEISKKYSSSYVFLAHNKNDNIETLVYRIIKGSAIRGLMSIPENRDIYYRPLLTVEKQNILEYLKINNQEYKIDCSNEDVKYKRNLIRKEILPLFEKINPSYLSNIENLIKTSISSCEIIDEVLENLIKELVVDDCVDREKYLSKSKALRYEFLNYFIGAKLKCRNYKNIKKIDDFIISNKSSQISVNKELFLKIKKNKIYYIKNKFSY